MACAQARENLTMLIINPPKMTPVSGNVSVEGRWTVSIFSPATGHYQFATDWLPFDEAVVSLAEETNNHAKYLIDLVKLARSEQ